MLIKEVCEICNLTKKAVEYYESKGLINPTTLENGYRDYGENEISTLKEISVLRHFDLSIAEIKEIMDSNNKSATLEKYKYVINLRMQKLAAIQKSMDNLIQDYNINREFDYLHENSDNIYTIKEKMVFAFPGNYGLFLSLHFGRFLNEPIDSEEKREAYKAIIKYLDETDLHLSPNLSEHLENAFIFSSKVNISEFQSKIGNAMNEVLKDTDAYLDHNEEDIKEYLKFKTSDDFKNSPANKLQQSLIEFQKKSGYREILIANMKILSKSYAEYLELTKVADEKFLKKFPNYKIYS